jgi:hypothetical protein
MNKNVFMELLGLRFNKLITDFHYPALHPSLFTTKDCDTIRSHLSGVSDQNEKLQSQIINLISKGNIEEIDTKNDSLIIGVKITHKSEMYLLELELNSYKWSYNSIQYLGQASRKKLIWILSSALALSLLLVLLLLSKNIERTSVADNKETPKIKGTEVQIAEHKKQAIGLEELQRIALENQYILLTSEELEKLVEAEEAKEQNDEEKDETEGSPGIPEENRNMGQQQEDQQEEQEKTVTITIQSGMTSYDVAVLLEEHGLARSVEEIEQLFVELRVQKKIRSGIFTLSLESTYLEIIQQLTSGGS